MIELRTPLQTPQYHPWNDISIFNEKSLLGRTRRKNSRFFIICLSCCLILLIWRWLRSVIKLILREWSICLVLIFLIWYKFLRFIFLLSILNLLFYQVLLLFDWWLNIIRLCLISERILGIIMIQARAKIVIISIIRLIIQISTYL